MSKHLTDLSQKELIEIIEQGKIREDNIREALLQKIISNDSFFNHLNIIDNLLEDSGNIEKIIEKNKEISQKTFLNNFNILASNFSKFGYENEDSSLNDWIRMGVYSGIDKNIVMATAISNNFSPKTAEHLLDSLPEEALSDQSFEEKDILKITGYVLETKYVQIEKQKDSLLFIQEKVLNNNSADIKKQFNNIVKEGLHNNLNLYKEVINEKHNMFNLQFEDIPFSKIINKLENDINRYSVDMSQLFLNRSLSHFIDGGIFDKDINAISEKNIDVYAEYKNIEKNENFSSIKPILNMFKNEQLKKDFSRLLLIRETELVMNSPLFDNKEPSNKKLKF